MRAAASTAVLAAGILALTGCGMGWVNSEEEVKEVVELRDMCHEADGRFIQWVDALNNTHVHCDLGDDQP